MMAKIVLRLNEREAQALYGALEYCDVCFRIGKMQQKIMDQLDAELYKREKMKLNSTERKIGLVK